MSYCLNPSCPKPADPLNEENLICRHCGSQLLLENRYRVKRLLGEGGFGKTYEVDDRGTPKVLKVLLINNPKVVSFFQQEAKLLSQLRHPGIPQVEADGYFTYLPKEALEPLHCLVMERIEGITLEAWQRRQNYRPLTESEALHWLKQLVGILHEVHQQLYFHRDIKPSNIILKENGQLVLIDFGSAREVSLTYLAKVSGDDLTGIVSPGYTPSEQANGKAVPQSDFFALGRTFVTLLTGKSPNDFLEDPRTGELLWQHRASHIQKPVIDLIDYLMATAPGNRPHNTQMILQRLTALEDILQWHDLYDQEYDPANARRRRFSPVAIAPPSPVTQIFKRGVAKLARPKNQLILSAGLLILGLLGMEAFQGFNLLTPLLKTEKRSPYIPPTNTNNLFNNRSPLEKMSLVDLSADRTSGVSSVAFSPNGTLLASGSEDGTVKIWQISTGQLLSTLKGHQRGVKAIAFSPDGKTLASGSADNSVEIWQISSGKILHTLEGHSAWVSSLAWSPNGQQLASGSYDNTVKIWQVKTGKLQQTLKGHSAWIFAIAWSPDSKNLVSGSFDDSIKIWSPNRSLLKRTLKGNDSRIFTLALSADGKTLISGNGDGSIRLWDLNTGRWQRTIAAHSDWVRSLAVSPDGRFIASGSGDRDETIKVWDLHSGDRFLTLRGHADWIRSLAFSPDSKTLASSSNGNTIELWKIP